MLYIILLTTILSLIGVIVLLLKRILYLTDDAAELRQRYSARGQENDTLKQRITTLESEIKRKEKSINSCALDGIKVHERAAELERDFKSLKKENESLLEHFERVLRETIYHRNRHTIPRETMFTSIEKALGEKIQFFERRRIDEAHRAEMSVLLQKHEKEVEDHIREFVKSE